MVIMVEIGFGMPAGLEVRKLDVYWRDSPQSKTSGISFTYTEVNVLVGETVQSEAGAKWYGLPYQTVKHGSIDQQAFNVVLLLTKLPAGQIPVFTLLRG